MFPRYFLLYLGNPFPLIILYLVEISVTLLESNSDRSLTHWSASISFSGPTTCTVHIVKYDKNKNRVLLDRQRYMEAGLYVSPMKRERGKLVWEKGLTVTLLTRL